VSELARSSEDEETEGGLVGQADELLEVLSILLADAALVDSLLELELEDVLTVVLPHTLEVRFIWELGGHLVRHDHILFLDDLGGEFTESLILSSESLGALRSSGI